MKISVRLEKAENARLHGVPVGWAVEMDIEKYLLGVVPAEIGNASIEASKAQAIAARTRALPYPTRGISVSDKSEKTQSYRAELVSSQAYPNAQLAVEATCGQVLTYAQKPLDTCAYSASNGGRTTSSEERWGGIRPYLIEQDDPWDFAVTKGEKTGHGVGMSQKGAKYAAALGISHEQILSFYYPGTTITQDYGKEVEHPMTSSNLILEFEKMVGWKYVWGSAKAGEVDCSGAFVYAMKKYGLTIYHGSNTIWRSYLTQKGKIGSIDQVPGMAVFRWRSTGEPDKFKGDGLGDFYHIGLYVGDGKVIEAKGTNYGVVVSSVNGWTHAGMVKGIQYTNNTNQSMQGGIVVAMMAKVKTDSGSLNLRASATQTAVILEKIPQGALVSVLDDSDAAWWKVSYNGKTGYVMASFLSVDASDGAGVRLIIPCDNRDEAEKLLTLMKSARIEQE